MSAPPENWKASAHGPPSGSVTTAAQDSLPKLPVPAVGDTFTRLRRSLKPIARNDAEFAESERKIDEFEKSGFARVLQDRLLERQKKTLHWLEEWWDGGAYNGYRDSVSFPFVVFLRRTDRQR